MCILYGMCVCIAHIYDRLKASTEKSADTPTKNVPHSRHHQNNIDICCNLCNFWKQKKHSSDLAAAKTVIQPHSRAFIDRLRALRSSSNGETTSYRVRRTIAMVFLCFCWVSSWWTRPLVSVFSSAAFILYKYVYIYMYTSQDCAVVVVTRHANARLGDAREQADATIALYAPRRQRKPLDETGLSRDRGLRPETQTHGLLLLC